jgi:hypothetical protein
MTPWNLLKDILVAVLLALLISFVGIAWIDYDVPGAWPDLIGPSETWRVEGVVALECAYRPGWVVGSHRSSPWTICRDRFAGDSAAERRKL